jgi:tRNA U38,U39,U40 pseudouridine synthase TruA
VKTFSPSAEEAAASREWYVVDALAAKDRSRSAPPAPANGLILEQVLYPAHLDPWQQAR